MAMALMILKLNRILFPYLKADITNCLRSLEDYKKKPGTFHIIKRTTE